MRIAFSLIVGLAWSAAAFETTPSSWVGFKPIADAAVPGAVRRAGDAIFEMWQPFGEPEIKDVSDIDFRTMSTDADKLFEMIQVRVCQVQALKQCPIMPRTYAGTAFLIEDQLTLATDLHNVHGWLYHARKNNPGKSPEEIQLPLLVVDQNHKVVFNPLVEGASVKLRYYNRSAKRLFQRDYPWEASTDSALFRLSEYVELQLGRPIPREPLTAGPVDSEQKFMAGYPAATSVFSRHGGQDAPGDQLVVSTGKIQNSPEMVNLITDIAAARVASGSPLLNRRGEVIGLLIAGAVDEIDGRLRVSSDFLQVDKTLLESVWATLPQTP